MHDIIAEKTDTEENLFKEAIDRLFHNIETGKALDRRRALGLILEFAFADGKGHAIYVHFDEKEGRYIICDQNLFLIEYNSDCFEEGIDWHQKVLKHFPKLYDEDLEIVCAVSLVGAYDGLRNFDLDLE